MRAEMCPNAGWNSHGRPDFSSSSDPTAQMGEVHYASDVWKTPNLTTMQSTSLSNNSLVQWNNTRSLNVAFMQK